MNILVTGGTGFIGSSIISFLKEKNHKLLVVSRNQFVNYPGVNYINLNWNSQKEINKTCNNIDVVIHTAGMNALDSYNNPEEALYFNGICTQNLLESAISNNVSKFIYFSTAHVYSDNFSGFFNEESNLKNLHPYATSHKFGEDAIINANKQKRISGYVLRLSNSFGIPVNINSKIWNSVFNDLCLQSISNKTIKLKSLGIQKRNFIPIGEVCKIVDFLIMNIDYMQNAALNIGSDNSYSIIEIAKLIQDRTSVLFGYKPEIIQITTNNNSNISYDFDYSISKLKTLGYILSFKLENELDILLNSINANLINEKS